MTVAATCDDRNAKALQISQTTSAEKDKVIAREKTARASFFHLVCVLDSVAMAF